MWATEKKETSFSISETCLEGLENDVEDARAAPAISVLYCDITARLSHDHRRYSYR